MIHKPDWCTGVRLPGGLYRMSAVRRELEHMNVNGFEAREDRYYVYKDGKLCKNVVAGVIPCAIVPTRKAGRYKVYVDSHRDVALPYSIYHIADTETGKVYSFEVTHGVCYRPLDGIVEALKEM